MLKCCIGSCNPREKVSTFWFYGWIAIERLKRFLEMMKQPDKCVGWKYLLWSDQPSQRQDEVKTRWHQDNPESEILCCHQVGYSKSDANTWSPKWKCTSFQNLKRKCSLLSCIGIIVGGCTAGTGSKSWRSIFTISNSIFPRKIWRLGLDVSLVWAMPDTNTRLLCRSTWWSASWMSKTFEKI